MFTLDETLGYSKIIPKDMGYNIDCECYNLIYEEFQYSPNEVSKLFDDINLFWDTVGKNYQYLQYSYDSFFNGSYISFMCRMSKVEKDLKPFEKVFDGKLDNHTILQYFRDDNRGFWIISLIDTSSKKIKIFELDFDKTINKKIGSMINLLSNYTKDTYQFNYEDENYFEKNSNGGLNFGLRYMEFIIYKKDIEWFEN